MLPGSEPKRLGLITAAEAAELLRVNVATVRALCRSGQLGHTRISNALRLTRADLDAYLAKGRR